MSWAEIIDKWAEICKENPPDFGSPSPTLIREFRDLLQKGTVYHGDLSTERLYADLRTVTPADLSWLYWNFLGCEYLSSKGACTYPPLDVLVPLNPLMAPPPQNLLRQSGRRACRRHAMNLVDPLRHYLYSEGEV